MRFQIGLMGCGSIGKRHLQNLLTYKNKIEKISIYDVNEKVLNSVRQLSNKINICTNKSELLNKKLDIVFICTPNSSHYADSIEFVEKGVPVFIEKPATISSNDCKCLLDACRSFIVVGCNMRYHPALLKARELILNKHLGEIISARAYFGHCLKNWRPGADYKKFYSAKADEGGGVLWDGIHEFDYLLWLFGDVKSECVFYKNRQILDIDVEEMAEVLLCHQNDIVSSIHLDYIQPTKRRGLEIAGSNGTFVWNSIGKNPEKLRMEVFYQPGEYEILYDDYYDINDAYLSEIKDIFDVLEGKKIDDTNLLDIMLAYKEIVLVENLKKGEM